MSGSEQSADLMTAYLDEELAPEDAAAFESLLEQDPAARSQLEDLRKVLELVAKLPVVEAPAGFADRVARKVRRRRILSPEGVLGGLVSIPFQVISVVVVLAVAALYMMAHIERATGPLERDPAAGTMTPPVQQK
jgi:anti-sigma factor RsiW